MGLRGTALGTGGTSGGTITLAIPAGAIVGDYAIIMAGSGVTGAPSGWTTITGASSSLVTFNVFVRTLSSGDISTGSFGVVFASSLLIAVAALVVLDSAGLALLPVPGGSPPSDVGVNGLCEASTDAFFGASSPRSFSSIAHGPFPAGTLAIYFSTCSNGPGTASITLGTQVQYDAGSQSVLCVAVLASPGSPVPAFDFTFGNTTVSATLLFAGAGITGALAVSSLPVIPLRIISIAEDENYNLQVECEPFIYGCSAPVPLDVTAVNPYQPQLGADPGVVNAPVIFEPIARLCGAPPAQIWLVVSAPSANYGGCIVYLSTNGGASYNNIGFISGSAITGVTVGDWPAAADPDTTHNLALNLTESLGALVSYDTADRDNFVFPCYVAGGAGNIPYELMAYNLATLTSAYHYTLAATGGGNELRRAVYSAPTVGQGVDHPGGSRFAFLGPQGPGILKLDMDPTWIGVTLMFKFAAYNNLQGALQSTSGLTAYNYTPTGIAQTTNIGNNNYSQIPGDALTNPTSTTIHMAQVSTFFPGNVVNYNARTFTIPAPSVPTTYYVTIADPTYIGDTGATANLTATCQTSQALCGAVGNTYIGSILAIPGGSGTVVTPGGWPPGNVFLVNGA